MLVAVIADADLAAFLPSAFAVGGLVLMGWMPGRADTHLAGRAFRDFLASPYRPTRPAASTCRPDFRQPTTLAAAVSGGVRLIFVLPASAIQPATEYRTWFLESIQWLSPPQ